MCYRITSRRTECNNAINSNTHTKAEKKLSGRLIWTLYKLGELNEDVANLDVLQ